MATAAAIQQPQSPPRAEPGRSANKLPLGLRVANALTKAKIAPLPRNYEIFYTAMSGADPDVEKDLLKLGTGMTQEQLDRLYESHFRAIDDSALVDRICEAVEGKLNETMHLLQSEQRSVANYSEVLNQASQRLDPSHGMPQDVVGKMVSLLAAATETTRLQGSETLETMLSSTRELASMRNELEEYKRLAQTDSLTGLYNRRAFDETLAKQDDSDLDNSAIIIGDIDNFKQINDSYGHPFGDAVIKTAAAVLKQTTRDDVVIARVGGEEFAILSHSINENGMMLLAERVRMAIEKTEFKDDKMGLPAGKVTMSFGVCHSEATRNSQELYAFADEALYASKRNGRNKVTAQSELGHSPDRKDLLIYQK